MTERRRKARNKTLKHGDLFHVYIASDTPPEVCAFLSHLKQQGDFSYEVLQIIEAHVRAELGSAMPQVAKNQEGSRDSGLQGRPQSDTRSALYEGFSSVVSPPSSATDATVIWPPSAATKSEPKTDPVQQLRQQRKAWVAGNTP